MKSIILYSSLVISFSLFSQSQFYSKKVSLDSDELVSSLLFFEPDQIFYTTYFFKDNKRIPTLYKLSNKIIVDSLQFINHYGMLFHLQKKDNKEFFVHGFILDSSTNKYLFSRWVVDTNLQVISSHSYLTKFNEQLHIYSSPRINDQHIITVVGYINNQITSLLIKLDSSGNFIDSLYFSQPGWNIGYASIKKNSSTILVPMYSSFCSSLYGRNTCLISLDSNLNLLKIDTVPLIQSGISTIINIKSKNEKEFYLSGLSSFPVGWNSCFRQSITLFDTSFNVKTTIHLGNLVADTASFPGAYFNFDYYDVNHLFASYTYNYPNNDPNFPFSTNPSWIAICNLDSNLNLRWKRLIGGDMNYIVTSIIATPDTGCLIAGVFYDSTYHVNQRDIFIVKTDKSGNIVSQSPNFITHKKHIYVYPNPALNEIKLIGTDPHRVYIVQIFDSMGKYVLNHNNNFNKIDISSLSAGIYFYRIIYNGQVVSQGKWVKL